MGEIRSRMLNELKQEKGQRENKMKKRERKGLAVERTTHCQRVQRSHSYPRDVPVQQRCSLSLFNALRLG